MKTIIELDQEDIRKIIAEKFNCAPCQVTVSIKKEYKGQGMSEHEVHICTATVKQIERELKLC